MVSATTIDNLIASVLSQLKGAVPAGDAVHFELIIGFNEEGVGVYESTYLPTQGTKNTISFDVVMPSENEQAS